MEVKIRLNNTKLGITTVWSLQKFEAKLMHMREIYQVTQTVMVYDTDVFTSFKKRKVVYVFQNTHQLTYCRCFLQQSESDSISGDEDPFSDPSDQWEKDFRLDSPSETMYVFTSV